jgi:membrane-associated protease RseP (regulator of RpoE activity)
MMTYGVAVRPMRGETRSGDAAAVVVREGFVMAVLIDGLGHGVGAAEVAEQALAVAVARAELRPEALLREMDEALVRSRGAVASVLRLEPGAGGGLASFAGVGNVGLCFRGKAPFAPVSMPGILGRRVRKVRAFEHALSRGDLLVLYTDGLSSRIRAGAS